MIWLTADNHFGHKNVIDYCKRPFNSVEEMDRVMIERWNSRVQLNDTVFHLGDFSFYGMVKSTEILNKLNGKRILIRGNHDKNESKMLRMGFSAVHDSVYLQLLDNKIVSLSHYPYQGKDKDPTIRTRKLGMMLEDTGSWLFCGHVHERWRTKGRMINVGVDQWNFAPCSLKTLVKFKEQIECGINSQTK